MVDTALILAGGRGTRLQSLVADVPKPLAPIAGQPFLHLLLRQLAQYNIRKVVLLTGHMHDLVQRSCQDGAEFGLEIVYSRELTPLGTAGAVLNAQACLQHEQEFLLLNGDTYLDCNAAEIMNFITQPIDQEHCGVIGVIKPEAHERFGSVQFDPVTKQVRAFLEKTAMATGYVNAGIYKFKRDIFNAIPSGVACSLEQEILPKILLTVRELCGMFYDIGVPESYIDFNERFTRQFANN